MKIKAYGILVLTCSTLLGCSEEESYEYPEYSYPEYESVSSYEESDPYSFEEESTEEEYSDEAEDSDTSSEYESSNSSSEPLSFNSAVTNFKIQTSRYQTMSEIYLMNLMGTLANGTRSFQLSDGVPMTVEEYRDKIREFTGLVQDFTSRYASELGYTNASQLRQIASNMESQVNSQLDYWDNPEVISLYETQIKESRYAYLLDTTVPLPEAIEVPNQEESNQLITFYLVIAENVRLKGNSIDLLEGNGPVILDRTKQVLEKIHQQLSE